jgi:hypothetical protein
MLVFYGDGMIESRTAASRENRTVLYPLRQSFIYSFVSVTFIYIPECH